MVCGWFEALLLAGYRKIRSHFEKFKKIVLKWIVLVPPDGNAQSPFIHLQRWAKPVLKVEHEYEITSTYNYGIKFINLQESSHYLNQCWRHC